MKIRTGFVTNSGSSSFVVGIEVTTKEGETAKLFFGDEVPDYRLYRYDRKKALSL